MGARRKYRQAWLAAAILAFTAAGVRADTIVLKNGRRIVALSVSQEGDKVRYETPAGSLSLPISIVDHIEHGGVLVGGASGGPEISLKPPTAEATTTGSAPNRGEIESRTLRNGQIDRDYIAELETAAHSGHSLAQYNAALAHHAASQYEMSRGEMDRALADERMALYYAPQHPVFLLDVAYLHLRRSEFTQSLEYLERAKRVAPEDPELYKLAGWAYFGLNKLDQAVLEWKHSEALRPDAEVEAALQKALRDKEEEARYRENESSHFTLRYNGAAEPSLARDVLRTLEHHFDAIESELSYTPPDSIGVVLYTQQAFADITHAPTWVGALNDGRIRVPVQGLGEVTPDLARVLKHELTHSFVQQKTRGRAPTWLQEGLAQWMEGKRSEQNAAALIQIYQADPGSSQLHFEGDWLKMANGTAELSYAWALANVEYIVKSGGMSDVDRILDALAGGAEAQQAVKGVLHDDYTELTKDTVEFLRKNYGN